MPEASTCQTIKILLVEDHEHIRKLVRASIRPLNIEIVECSDSLDALAKIESQASEFSIIILDVMLPGPLNGFELCARIKASAPGSAFVLMLTARAQESDKIAARECRADHFMTKPFSPLELLQVVRARVEHQNARSARHLL